MRFRVFDGSAVELAAPFLFALGLRAKSAWRIYLESTEQLSTSTCSVVGAICCMRRSPIVCFCSALEPTSLIVWGGTPSPAGDGCIPDVGKYPCLLAFCCTWGAVLRADTFARDS